MQFSFICVGIFLSFFTIFWFIHMVYFCLGGLAWSLAVFFFNLKQAMKCVILGLILAELICEGKLVFVSSLTNVVSFLVCHLLVALEWGSEEVPHINNTNITLFFKLCTVNSFTFVCTIKFYGACDRLCARNDSTNKQKKDQYNFWHTKQP